MNRTILKVVVASPGDVQEERVSLERVMDDLNSGVAEDRGLRVESLRWETDAHPGFHADGPQGLIDSILNIEESDVVIGIFWKRFGTPMKGANSGTEHEISKAYETWRVKKRPAVMVYFSREPYSPRTSEEAAQWSLVLAFKEKFPKDGLWWEYDRPMFEVLVRRHLQRYIRDNYALPSLVANTTEAREAELERGQIITDRRRSITESRKELAQARVTGDFLMQYSRAVRSKLRRLGSAMRLNVHEQLMALTQNPYPPTATRDEGVGILWLRVPETEVDVGYLVDEEKGLIKLMNLEDSAPEGATQ